MTEERLDRIENLLAAALEQQAQSQKVSQEQQARDRRDWIERDRQLAEKLNQIAQQQAQFQDGLNETKALQQQNAKAISQLTLNLERLRQATANNAASTSDIKAELARHADDTDAHMDVEL